MAHKTIVLDKVTKEVLRYGYADFENDGTFDGANEEIITKHLHLDPPLQSTRWEYNEGPDTFTIIIP